MRSVAPLLLVLATLAVALTACAPAAPPASPDPQHANAKPLPNTGPSGGGY
ncbi:MAG TPA: hypothetical protein VK741_07935 [Acetobacteraceae bacterium]|nr:hypothetical protein [Acetobacteraceae bacterium]